MGDGDGEADDDGDGDNDGAVGTAAGVAPPLEQPANSAEPASTTGIIRHLMPNTVTQHGPIASLGTPDTSRG